MSLAWSIFGLLILLMQSLNGPQFKYWLFIIIIYISICSYCIFDWYIFINKYTCITMITYLTNCIINWLFFGSPLLCYYLNLRSSTILCFFFGDTYLSFGISSNPAFFVPLSTVFELFCGKVFKKFVVLWVILLPIKSPVPSADFWIAYFETILSASVSDSSVWSRRFWLYLPLEFLSRSLLIFLGKYKSPNPFTRIHSLGSVE